MIISWREKQKMCFDFCLKQILNIYKRERYPGPCCWNSLFLQHLSVAESVTLWHWIKYLNETDGKSTNCYIFLAHKRSPRKANVLSLSVCLSVCQGQSSLVPIIPHSTLLAPYNKEYLINKTFYFSIKLKAHKGTDNKWWLSQYHIPGHPVYDKIWAQYISGHLEDDVWLKKFQ